MDTFATGNRLLDLAVKSDDGVGAGILKSCDRVDFATGAWLQAAGNAIEFAYFPVDGALSLKWTLEDESEAVTLSVGCDGGINATPCISLDKAAHGVVAALPGWAWRISAPQWQDLLSADPRLNQLYTQYAQSTLLLTQREIACHMNHDVESRFCRLLLQMHSWCDGRPLTATHQTLARVLGVRRTTITLLACELQNAGIISYSRGTIDVIDAEALRVASCDCHLVPRGNGSHNSSH